MTPAPVFPVWIVLGAAIGAALIAGVIVLVVLHHSRHRKQARFSR